MAFLTGTSAQAVSPATSGDVVANTETRNYTDRSPCGFHCNVAGTLNCTLLDRPDEDLSFQLVAGSYYPYRLKTIAATTTNGASIVVLFNVRND